MTLTNGAVRFTLFNDRFIQKEFGVSHLFNFRGGNVEKNYKEVSQKNIKFTKTPSVFKDGSIDAKFIDFDGNVFYLDTHRTEVGGQTFTENTDSKPNQFLLSKSNNSVLLIKSD